MFWRELRQGLLELRLNQASGSLTLRAGRASLVGTAAGLAASYRLLPDPIWMLAAALTLVWLVLALGLARRMAHSPSTAVAGALLGVAGTLAITIATGGLRSPLVAIDVALVLVVGTVVPPPTPLLLAALEALLLALATRQAPIAWTSWREAVAVSGALLAGAPQTAQGYASMLASWRDQQRLSATRALGLAMVSLDTERLLPELAAQVGLLAQAAAVVVRVEGSSALRPTRAAWRAAEAPAAQDEAHLDEAAELAARQGQILVRVSAPEWSPWDPRGQSRLRPTAAALPLRAQHGGPGGLALRMPPGHPLLPWTMEAVEELAGYGTLGIQAAHLHADSQRQALLDPVTHLYNVRYLTMRLEEEVALGRREGRPLSLLFLDSDSLKLTNDRHGHQYGDRLVRSLAQMISQHIRPYDVAVRYAGGDEFVVILPNTDWPEAAEVAERLRAHAREVPVGPHGTTMGTVSIGVATFPAHAASAQELIARADQAMYVAKSRGKDCVAVFGVSDMVG